MKAARFSFQLRKPPRTTRDFWVKSQSCGGIMQKSRFFTVMLMGIFSITSFACKNTPPENEREGKSEGEETGPRLTTNETYNAVRNGVRLILAYDSASSSFNGTVENVTNKTVFSVRVEVHLSDGTELGPTSPIDLAPGDKADVKMSDEGHSFTWWKAHAETGEAEHGGEHGDDGEHGGEHSEEHRDEHGREAGENH